MKSRSILFAVFVFFYCFVSDCCSHQQHQAHQPEDHWRWRQNLDIAVRFNNQLYHLPSHLIHNELANVEQDVTRRINNPYSNTAIAAITIVYESQDEQGTRVLRSKTQWLRLNDEGTIYYFPSNRDAQIPHQNTRYRVFAQPTISLLFARMKDTWNEGGILNNTIDRYDEFMGFLQAYQPSTVQAYHHSEQRIIEYLSRVRQPEDPQRTLQLMHLINNMGVNRDFLKLIVVHIHSKLDPCDNCSKSLSLFSHYMNHRIRQYYGDQQHNENEEPNVKFLVTVSSRVHHQNSRFQKGHDNSYNWMITVDVNNNLQPPPLLPPGLGGDRIYNVDVIPPSMLRLIQFLNGQPEQHFVFNPHILYFRMVLPDPLPILQNNFQRLNF